MAELLVEANWIKEQQQVHLIDKGTFEEAMKTFLDNVRFVDLAPQPTSAEVADLLEQVADRFQSGVYKWRQKAVGAYGTYCTIGALAYVATGNASLFQGVLVQAAAEAIMKHLGWVTPSSVPTGQVAWWNDKPSRTVDQVIEALKATAKDLRNEA